MDLTTAAGIGRFDALFEWVVRASWQASVVVLLVLAAQWTLGERLGAKWRYALWLLVAVRLAAPPLPGSTFSVFNLAPPGTLNQAGSRIPENGSAAKALVRVVVLPTPGAGTRSEVAGATAFAPAQAATSPPPAPHPWTAAAFVWLAGVLVLTSRLLWVNVRFYRRIRRLPPLDDPAVLRLLDECRLESGVRRRVPAVVVSGAEGPALLGLFRSRLLLPNGLLARLGPDELRLVFLHELAHLRRLDVLAEWVLTLAQTVHWFNPVIWLACARCRADRELACDAQVLALAARQDDDRRNDYGRTILKLAGATVVPVPRPLAAVGILEGRAHLKRRIRMISRFDPSPKAYRTVVALAAMLLVGCVALTDADERGERQAAGAGESQTARRSNEPAKTAPDATTVEPPSGRLDVGGSRNRTVAEEERKVRPQDAAIRAQLDRPLPEVNFDAAAFADVIDFFRDVSGANVFVNWRALEAAGIDRNAPVSARLRNVKFSKALQVVLDGIGGGNAKLGFQVDDGVITISMADDLDRDTVTRVYDIRDLIAVIPDRPAPLTLPRDPTVRTDVVDDKAAGDEIIVKKREALAEEVIRLIKETVDPEAWGKFNAIRHLQGQLVITAPVASHASIIGLLDQLRETRSVQVLVEMKFLAVGDGALEKLEPGLRDRLGRVLRTGKPQPQNGGGEPEPAALHLDDEQARAVLAAADADARSQALAAPKLILSNGQRSHFLIGHETPYVADYAIVKSPDGGAKYEPRVDKAQAGLLVDVTGTVSADRKYVTLTLWPRLSHLKSITDVPWEKAPAGEKLTVQRPNLLVSELQMTVSVPDGATLAAGGLRGVVKLGEDEKALQERNVLMLVKPRIIVQREIEVKSAPIQTERR